jgi:hypothetical protein
VLYLYPPSGPHRACNGVTLPFTLTFISQLIPILFCLQFVRNILAFRAELYVQPATNKSNVRASRLVIRGRWLRVRGSVAGVVGAELCLSEGTIDTWKGEALQLKISSAIQLYCADTLV